MKVYYETSFGRLYHGSCLELHEAIKSGSVDLILTDLPYGIMAGQSKTGIYHDGEERHEWDCIIPTEKIMSIANRVLRKNGKMLLFAQADFVFELYNKAIPSLPYSYKMIWEKDSLGSFMRSKKAPLYQSEDILVFRKSDSGENNETKNYLISEKEKAYKNGWTDKKLKVLCGVSLKGGGLLCHYWGISQWLMPTEKIYNKLKGTGFFKKPFIELKEIHKKYESIFNLWDGKKHKSNILKYKKDYNGYHPTQKPILLIEDLIKTFSNECDLVVDLTCGSGTTCVACERTNRKWIGIEKELKYVEIAAKRIEAEASQLKLFR